MQLIYLEVLCPNKLKLKQLCYSLGLKRTIAHCIIALYTLMNPTHSIKIIRTKTFFQSSGGVGVRNGVRISVI